MPSSGFSGLLATRHYKKPVYFQRATGSSIFEKNFGYLLSRENLLDQYLSLPEDQREHKFPTTEGAARLIEVSRRTIQFWVDAGDIEAIFVGRSYRVNFDSLVIYLKSRVIGRKHS